MKTSNKTTPIYSTTATHPGEVLKEEIEACGLTKNSFAAQLSISPKHVTELLRGERNISPLLALKLEETLNINAEFWLQLQNRYNLTILRKARAESQDKQTCLN